MAEQNLFGELPEQIGAKREAGVGAPRLWEPERDAIELRAMCLDSLIGADHPARLIWAYVLRLDLRELEKLIKAREGVPGHPALTPRLLLGLWLYATSEAVSSARLLAKLCERDDVYRWFCGGVGVNHRTLGEFRVDHGDLLNRLLAQSVTALAAEGLIDLDMLAQDGVRVRASSGASSFRRRARMWRATRRRTSNGCTSGGRSARRNGCPGWRPRWLRLRRSKRSSPSASRKRASQKRANRKRASRQRASCKRTSRQR